MATLITGATGYIGSILTKKLADRGEKIKILCRSNPDIAAFKHDNISIVYGDIMDKNSLSNALEGVENVYHMAAYARLWAKNPNVFRQINVEGTRNVLEASLNAGVKKLVYTSTAGVIGPSKDHPMRETDARIMGFFNEYEETKATAEKVALEYVAKGLEICIVNPSRIYGPGLDTGSNPVTKVVEMYLKNKWKVIPGNGRDIGSYCYIDDVVDGLIAAMEIGKNGERYIFGGINATFNELMQTINNQTGIHKKLPHLPFSILLGFSYILETIAQITGKPPLITPKWVKKYNYNWALDSSKAIKELNYKIRDLDEGIQLTVDWVKQNRM